MNRILFRRDELGGDGCVVLADRRARHIVAVLRGEVGQCVRLGMIDGDRGQGRIEEAGASQVRLRWEPAGDPPPPAQVDVLLALPRPKVLKRLWSALASLGVGRIVLTNAAKVERQYFDTHWLRPDVYMPLLIEGLEQSGDTRLPEVRLVRQFKPFVEDELDALFPGGLRLLAQPGPTELPLPTAGKPARILLAIGPEGGWTPFEAEFLATRGFRGISLGWRTLRSDVASVGLVAWANTLVA